MVPLPWISSVLRLVAPSALATASSPCASAVIGAHNRTEASRGISVRIGDLPWVGRLGSVAGWIVGAEILYPTPASVERPFGL
jgi:hypothetical protein